MNFLLLERDEIGPDGTSTLRGRRAEHVREVLRAAVGQELRAGIVDGPLGSARVLAVTPDEVAVATTFGREPAAADDVLLLAVPRPKVLLRVLAHASALGFGRIVLCRSWRVDKSHLESTAMRPEVQREHLLLGLEQAGRTRVPRVAFFPRFKPMVEDSLPGFGLPEHRYTAHPSAATPTRELAAGTRGPFALAIGPDGGWLPYEVDALAALGFLPVACGPHALRTETAIAVLFGQLDLLRQRGSLAP